MAPVPGVDQSIGSTSQVIVRIPRLAAVAMTLAVDRAARRPEEAGPEVGVGGDPRGGAGDLRVVGVFDVVHRVVADLVAFGEDLAHRRFAARHLLADLEEGAVDVLFAQHVRGSRACIRWARRRR